MNATHKWYVIYSALAVFDLLALVVSNGHHMERLHALPLVVKNKVNNYKKAKKVMLPLTKLKAWDDIKKVWLDLSK